MTRRVLDVGNCRWDHAAVCALFQGELDALVTQVHTADESLRLLRAGGYDLVLVNRRFHRDRSDGMDLIRAIKGDPQLAVVPVMLVSNHPEFQDEAVALGAEPGFGKSALSDPGTRDKLARALGAPK